MRFRGSGDNQGHGSVIHPPWCKRWQGEGAKEEAKQHGRVGAAQCHVTLQRLPGGVEAQTSSSVNLLQNGPILAPGTRSAVGATQ